MQPLKAYVSSNGGAGGEWGVEVGGNANMDKGSGAKEVCV